ncbi:MAG TPA: hypothetical protein VMG12_36235, partial [Polyangiaceae bacterium]|nr:hypothetical protein [Polyangiaceae bacterium]
MMRHIEIQTLAAASVAAFVALGAPAARALEQSVQGTDAVPSTAVVAPMTPHVANVDDLPQPTGAELDADAEADAVVAALGDDSADRAVADVEEFKLNLYGFMDFTYVHQLNDFAFGSPYPTFMVGNINLYAGAELGDGWRSLVEFRLLYAPHGTIASVDQFSPVATPIDTTVGDPADLNRPMRWGGVEIERAWLEYSAHPLLTIRGGQWLTPYGIWNVDHGSPVIIGVRRPYIIGEGLIPERQTGVSIYGSQLVGTTELGYNVSLSNGRGPVDSYRDLDHNKALTARLSAVNESPLGTLSLGVTLFRGRYTDRPSSVAFGPNGEVGLQYITRNRYDELSVGADLRWIWQGLTLQSEFITRETA